MGRSSNFRVVVPFENAFEPVYQLETAHTAAVVESRKEPSVGFLGA